MENGKKREEVEEEAGSRHRRADYSFMCNIGIKLGFDTSDC